MYDDIFYVFMNKDSPWTLSIMCISKYVTCLWNYATAHCSSKPPATLTVHPIDRLQLATVAKESLHRV